MEFARTKEQLFERWCPSKKVGCDHAKLRKPMLVEEFKSYINSDDRAFLNEKEVDNLDFAARLADEYSLTQKASFLNKQFPRKPFKSQLKFTPQSRPFSPQSKSFSPQSGTKSNHSNPYENSSYSFASKPKFSSKSENNGQSP